MPLEFEPGRLHGDIDPTELHRGRSEVEAESVAYVLAGLLGLDASDYSVGYIADGQKGAPTPSPTPPARSWPPCTPSLRH